MWFGVRENLNSNFKGGTNNGGRSDPCSFTVTTLIIVSGICATTVFTILITLASVIITLSALVAVFATHFYSFCCNSSAALT